MTPRRVLASMSLLPLLAAFGCDALTVRSFAGTVGQLTFAGVTATTIPANQHLEMWARTQYNDIVRINGYTNLNAGTTAYGFMIRQAISADPQENPCMIDSQGHLLTSPDAYQTTTSAGVTQTPDEQAQQIKDRIAQLTSAGTAGPLLAVLPYDPTPVPSIPTNADPTTRKAACDAYTDPSHPNTYVPNPYQITAPAHGTVYGFVSFVSVSPPADFDGFRVDMPLNLKGVQEIFFTLENDMVDPMNRGPLFLTSTPTPGGRDIVHFDLTHADPNGTASGTAALEVDLDQDPVMF